MKEAKTFEEANESFTLNKTDGFIQWKGTDVCMDLHCECGFHNHYDGYFAYEVKCRGCGNIYALSPNVEVIKITNSINPNVMLDESEQEPEQ